MKVIYIKKRTIANLFLVFILVVFSIVYTRWQGLKVLGAYLNNEKMMPVYCVEVPDKRVALTFDGAWGDQYTQDILDVLKRYNIKATFFLTGSWIDKYTGITENIYKGGHEIGNHSTTHVDLTKLPKHAVVSEIKDTESKIINITGKSAKLFRVPFGEYNNNVITTARNEGCSIIQWDVSSDDWRDISEQDIFQKVTSEVGGGSIILFHNNVKNTPQALTGIIEKLREEGYKFVTVSELLLKENYYIDNTGKQRSIE